jgi:1,4-dihydroxy-2-naphthoyl-CoA synthase
LYDGGIIDKNIYIVCNGFKRPQYVENIASLVNNGFENTIPILDNKRELNLLDDAINKPCQIGIRIASEKARFGQPEVGLGITAGFGGTQRLPRLVGRGAASLLLFSGNMIDAAEALRIGLVDKIVPHDALAAEVSALAEGIARQARCAVQQTKRCIRHGLESGLESGLSYEAQAFGLCFSTKEQKDRMRAFVNRRR